MMGLTRHQADLLRYICGFQEMHGGVSPSVDEMRVAAGRASNSSITEKLDALEDRGRIRRLRNRARAIEVLAPLPIPHGPCGAPLFFVAIGDAL